MIQTSANLGMQTMDQGLRDAYLRGLISYEMAMERAMNPPELEKMIRSSTMPGQGSGQGGR